MNDVFGNPVRPGDQIVVSYIRRGGGLALGTRYVVRVDDSAVYYKTSHSGPRGNGAGPQVREAKAPIYVVRTEVP